MLVPSELASKLIANVVGPDSASAFRQLGDTLSDYVKQNAVVNFAWVGATTTPPPTPDPTVVATGKIINFNLELSPSFSPDPVSAFALLSLQFQVGWALATYNITSGIFSTTPGVVGTALPLVITIAAPDRNAAMLLLATQFITWIKSHIPLAPCSGSNGPYVGSGTVVSIT